MNKIYDNGSCLLGRVCDILKYIINELDDIEDSDDLINDLINDLKKYYNENDIVFIDYDRPMGYGIDSFNEKDLIKEND